ncbi:BrnA antitoxin family protein [Candidatus Uhrbacteria bacterium]|nr:BrnA antitoxin family protein [Candidatus Uhrbacteria bacterium]
MKKKFTVPKLKNKKKEFEFFSNLDLSEYFEKSDFIPVSFPNLRHSTQSISLRLPEYILSGVKEQANVFDMPYQALMKRYIADGMRRDRVLERD